MALEQVVGVAVLVQADRPVEDNRVRVRQVNVLAWPREGRACETVGDELLLWPRTRRVVSEPIIEVGLEIGEAGGLVTQLLVGDSGDACLPRKILRDLAAECELILLDEIEEQRAHDGL